MLIEERKSNSELQDSFEVADISPIMAKIYIGRGLDSKEQITELVPSLMSYKSLLNIDLVCDRLVLAYNNKEHIVIVADYDADGATSCAIVYKALKGFGFKVDFLVPNRFEHGYGLTKTVVELVNKVFKPSIILTVDNGISSIEGVSAAKALGIEVIVTDHHLQGDDLPDTPYIVNPNQKMCLFKEKSLAGCGVAFYVMSALRKKMIDVGILMSNSAFNTLSLLDLVAVGTVADVVSLSPNNRYIVKKGLDIIKKGNCNPGVLALFEKAKKDHRFAKSSDIGFGVGPRINAAGRLDDMSIGIRCLISDTFEEAMKYANQLDTLNVERKDIENGMKDRALSLVEVKKDVKGIVIYDASFHEGVVGIISSRIKELHNKPVITFAGEEGGDFVKGSARSIPGFHIRDALDYIHKKNPALIVKFGGHSMAAGLTLKYKDLKFFETAFEDISNQLVTDDMVAKKMLYDLELPIEYMTIDFAKYLEEEVWGQHFEEPIFKNIFSVQELKVINGLHTKYVLQNSYGYIFNGIYFNNIEDYSIGSEIDVLYSLGVNRFNDRESINLMIKKII